MKKIARYSLFGESSQNFRNFTRYGVISKTTYYITLKHHSVSAISNIACYFFVGGYEVSEHIMWVWSKQTYDANHNC